MKSSVEPIAANGDWRNLPRQVAVVSHGVRIGLAASNEQGLQLLQALLPPGIRACRNGQVDVAYTFTGEDGGTNGSTGSAFVATVDGEELARSTEAGAVLQTVDRYLKLHIAEHAPRRVFVHAGVVAWKGRGIVIPGSSYSGKSTLVAAFVRAGATYYSDEYAVVDPSGRIHPYLQPIQLREIPRPGSADGFGVHIVNNGKEPINADLILVTKYRPRGIWRPRRVSAGIGMLALLANTVSARRDPRRALQNLARLMNGAIVLKGNRGDAEQVVRHLLRSRFLSK